MEPQPSSKRGIVVLVVVLGVSALLGGLYGPSVRATAAGTKDTDVQDSVKSFTAFYLSSNAIMPTRLTPTKSSMMARFPHASRPGPALEFF